MAKFKPKEEAAKPKRRFHADVHGGKVEKKKRITSDTHTNGIKKKWAHATHKGQEKDETWMRSNTHEKRVEKEKPRMNPDKYKQQEKKNPTYDHSMKISHYSNTQNSAVLSKWYNGFTDEPDEFPELPKADVEALRSEAKRILDDEILKYEHKSKSVPGNSNFSWLRTMMSKGTVSDKIAANVICIQNSPLHSLSTIKNLVSMVKVGKKNECIRVIETLTELFLTDLLIPGRGLRHFENCPLAVVDSLSSGNKSVRNSHLVRWYFEDQLKNLYGVFVQALQAAAHDSVESNKAKAVSAMHKLLTGNPEHEQFLLTNLVNKLGDPIKAIASKALYCLRKLLYEHPNMKIVVMEEIEKLLFRPNVSARTQYYGICFLMQYTLSYQESTVAVNLIKLYFSFFKASLKKGDVDTRLMKALLTGVNRAYRYAADKIPQIEEHIETLYKVVHIANFKISLNALSLLYQVCAYKRSVSDRFYAALYKKILDPQLASSHHALFLSLVYRALKNDMAEFRVRAFVKRLLQVCMYLPAYVACAIMYMISQLIHQNIALKSMSVKSIEFNSDDNVDDDNEEHYQDVKLQENENEKVSFGNAEINQSHVEKEKKPAVAATWFHSQNIETRANKNMAYNPNQRNPLFAGAEFSAYTELLQLSHHHHPSVVLFASNLLQDELIKYTGDPLYDFTPTRFLERFVFKNPKKDVGEESKLNALLPYKQVYFPSGMKALAVNSANYINADESKVPVDEVFLYKYLVKRNEGKKQNNDDDSDDVSSVASDEFEEMMDKLMGKKENIDFADEVGNSLSNKQKAKGEDNHSVDQSGDEDEDDMDDDIDEASDIEFSDGGGDYDDDDDADIVEKMPQQSSKQKSKTLKKGAKAGIDKNIFASADEFAEILENAGHTNAQLGRLASLCNKDNAAVKQLQWEMKREQWVKGRPNRNKRKMHGKSRTGHKKFKK